MKEPRRAFQELMTDALDGRLSKKESDHFDAYLAESPQNQREWEAYREVRTTLLGIGTESAPKDFLSKLHTAMRRDDASDSSDFENGRTAAQAQESTPLSRPAASSWSHFQRLGWVRTAALFFVLIAVSSLLWEDGRRTTDARDLQVAESNTQSSRRRSEHEAKSPDEEEAEEQSEASDLAALDAKDSMAWTGSTVADPAAMKTLMIQDAMLNDYAKQIGLQVDEQAEDFSEDADAIQGGGERKSLAQSTDKVPAPVEAHWALKRFKEITAPSTPAVRVGTVSVAEETLYHLGKVLPELSGRQLQNRGLNQLSKDADRRFSTVLSRQRMPKEAKAPATAAKPQSNPTSEDSAKSQNRGATLKRPPNAKSKDARAATRKGKSFERPQREGRVEGSAQPLPNGAPSKVPAADAASGGGGGGEGLAGRPKSPKGYVKSKKSRGGSKRGKNPPTPSRKQDIPSGSRAKSPSPGAAPPPRPAATPAPRRSPAPPSKGRFSPPDDKANGGSITPPKGTTASRLRSESNKSTTALFGASTRSSLPPVGGRTFYGVFGAQARTRLAKVLKGYPSAKPLAVQPIFETGGGSVAGTAQPAPAYALWEIPVNPAEVGQLVGALESIPGVSLRVLGRSLLKGMTSAPLAGSQPGAGARGRGSNPPAGGQGGRGSPSGKGGSGTPGGTSPSPLLGEKASQVPVRRVVMPQTTHTVIIAIFDQ